MNKVDVKKIDKKWQDFWKNNKKVLKDTDKKKNTTALKCFLTRQEKSIWVM